MTSFLEGRMMERGARERPSGCARVRGTQKKSLAQKEDRGLRMKAALLARRGGRDTSRSTGSRWAAAPTCRCAGTIWLRISVRTHEPPRGATAREPANRTVGWHEREHRSFVIGMSQRMRGQDNDIPAGSGLQRGGAVAPRAITGQSQVRAGSPWTARCDAIGNEAEVRWN
jgi:hypothetical protein